MQIKQIQPFDWEMQPFQTAHSDDYYKLLFNHFAGQVDSRIQTDLYAQLMERYVSNSQTLEETVKKLSRSDTLRKQAEDIAMLGNWVFDTESRKLEWSDTMYTITGISRDQEPGFQKFAALVYPEDIPAFQSSKDMLLAGLSPDRLTYRLQTPDGSTKWVSAQYMINYDSQGGVKTIFGTLQDITAAREAELQLKRYNDQLEDLVQEKAAELFASQTATIHALVKLAESRDDDTGEHIERIAKYSHSMAKALQADGPYAAQVNDAFVRDIAMASPLHDIGKVGIPDRILLKSGRLTPDEFLIMKTHVTIGYETLASVDKSYPGNSYLEMGIDIARYHHEKWDGTGYMDGIKGADIPLAARILALCDVYDALRSRRVYKESYSHEKSVGIIAQGKGTHFDPVLIDLFLAHHKTFEEIFDQSVRS